MADWTDIPDAQLEPGKAIRSSIGIAFRDNVVAQAEGAAGAPKTQTAALEDDAVTADKLSETTAERGWVNGRIATSGVGDVGTYAMLYRASASASPGEVVSDGLYFSNAGAVAGTPVGGSWRCMGEITGSGPGEQSTLWLRIS